MPGGVARRDISIDDHRYIGGSLFFVFDFEGYFVEYGVELPRQFWSRLVKFLPKK